MLNLTRPLPAAYRLSAAGSHGSKAAAAAGLKSFYPAPSVDGGALAPTMALKRHAGLPANIWTLLEDMDSALAEPVYEHQPVIVDDPMSAGVGAPGDEVVYGGRQARRKARDARMKAEVEALGDMDWM